MPTGRLVTDETAQSFETAGRKTVPGSYVIYKDGSNYYAENLRGGTDGTPGTIPATLFNEILPFAYKVHVKKDTYPLTAKLNLKSDLFFDCEPGTIFTNNDAFSTVSTYEGVFDAAGTLASPITNLHLRGFKIEVTGRDTDGITFEHVNDGSIEDVIVKGFTGSQGLEEGIQIAGCHRVSLRKILVETMGSVGQTCLEIGGHLTSFEPSSDIFLHDYVAKNAGDTGLDITGGQNVYARNFHIDTPASINPGGIRIYSNSSAGFPQTKNVFLSYGEVNNSGRNGIYLLGRVPGSGGGELENIGIKRVTVRNCIQRGILIGQNTRRVRMEDCAVYSNGTEDTTATAGIETAPAVVGDVSDIDIINSTVYSNSYPATATNRRAGIHLFQTNRVKTIGNVVYANGGDGIMHNRITNFICIGNHVYNNSGASSGNSNGIEVASTSGVELSDEGVLANNRCYDDQTPTKNQGYGIFIASVNCKNIIVVGNDCRGNKTGSINNLGDVSNIIAGNPGFNPMPAVSGLNNIVVETTTKSTAPVDADFTNPRDGLIVVTPSAIYVRTGGIWKSAAIA